MRVSGTRPTTPKPTPPRRVRLPRSATVRTEVASFVLVRATWLGPMSPADGAFPLSSLLVSAYPMYDQEVHIHTVVLMQATPWMHACLARSLAPQCTTAPRGARHARGISHNDMEPFPTCELLSWLASPSTPHGGSSSSSSPCSTCPKSSSSTPCDGSSSSSSAPSASPCSRGRRRHAAPRDWHKID